MVPVDACWSKYTQVLFHVNIKFIPTDKFSDILPITRQDILQSVVVKESIHFCLGADASFHVLFWNPNFPGTKSSI